MMLSNILQFIQSFLFLLSFFSPLFGGGIFVVILSSFYFANLTDLLIIFIFGILGFSFFDSLLFMMGRLSTKFKLFRIRCLRNLNTQATKFYDKRLRPNYFTTIFSSKILFGFAIATIIFMGRREESFRRFIFFDFLNNLLLVFFFILFGALIGGGFRWISDFYENKLFLFLFIAIIISLIFLFEKLMRKAFRILF